MEAFWKRTAPGRVEGEPSSALHASLCVSCLEAKRLNRSTLDARGRGVCRLPSQVKAPRWLCHQAPAVVPTKSPPPQRPGQWHPPRSAWPKPRCDCRPRTSTAQGTRATSPPDMHRTDHVRVTERKRVVFERSPEPLRQGPRSPPKRRSLPGWLRGPRSRRAAGVGDVAKEHFLRPRSDRAGSLHSSGGRARDTT